MKEYLAHWDGEERTQLLREHIIGTASRAGREGKKIGIGYIVQLIALLHDCGKYSEDFQAYIRPDTDCDAKVNHTSAGAEILEKLCRNKSDNLKFREFYEIICYVITAHHGLYDLVTLEEKDNYTDRLSRVDENELNVIWNRWSEELEIQPSSLEQRILLAFREYIDIFYMNIKDIPKNEENENMFYVGCFERLLMSIQMDSDWSDTANAMGEGSAEKVPEVKDAFAQAWDHYQSYMKQLQEHAGKNAVTEKQQSINQIRSMIQQECLDFTRHGAGIYCLSIPTGAGKTLASLGYALKFAAEHIGSADEIERIIYISPYISITEQNTQVLKDAIGNTEWILEHHCNVANSDEQPRDIDIDWEERFICTTMVQFMNTLFSDKKKSIRRFHKLKKSIIILDEIQSMPVKAIHTFNLMMNFLNQVCQTNIILCTATQPMLDAPYVKRKIMYTQPRNMTEDLNHKYKQFERVKLESVLSKGKLELDSLADLIEKDFLEARSILVIFNKKKPVEDFFDKMQEKLKNVEIFYLTTNLCAEHRKNVLNDIKMRLKNSDKKILIISTNLIEAGVDLSVECVYRSLTGVDSIAQAAGRCNRNGELECGMVKIFELLGDEPGRYMDELAEAQEITRQILYYHEKKGAKESIIYPEWIQQYYDLFYEKLEGSMDFQLKGQYQNESIYNLLSAGFSGIEVPHVLKHAFKTAGEKYQVISDTGISVIVPYENGERMIGELEACTERGDIKAYLKKLQCYTVSIYQYKIEELLQKGGIRECKVLPDVYIALGYDKDKGLTDMMPEAIF